MRSTQLKSLGWCFFLLILSGGSLSAFDTISFHSWDGLEITADLYMPHANTSPFIILFHQAGYSRGEYREIAPKLNDLGFNVMTVDQRSGNEVNGIVNETAARAEALDLSQSYVDALPDLYAAIRHVEQNYAAGKLIIWGSSYSSALSLKIVGDNPNWIDGVLSFSPGEYFRLQGDNYISNSAVNISAPVFITSAKSEEDKWRPIYDVIPTTDKTYFLPQEEGRHGSSALWEETPEQEDVWQATRSFLTQFLVNDQPLLRIKANNSGATLALSDGELVSISIHLSTQGVTTEPVDWWVFADTSFGAFSYVYPTGWQVGINRTIQFPIIDIPSFTALNMALPKGSYTFTFTVDNNGDDALKDSVKVIIE